MGVCAERDRLSTHHHLIRAAPGEKPTLEREVQGHLNLAWAANGLIHLAKAIGRVVELLTLNRDIVVVLVL